MLLASDAGYGFVTQISDLTSKTKNGKAVLSLPKNAKVLSPVSIENVETGLIAAVTSEGRMLVFPVSELPVLARGKGNKIINIPSARAQSREELMTAMTVVAEGQSLLVYAGKQYLRLSPSDLEHYKGERGRRGNKLPRGYQRVTELVTE